MSRYHGAMRYKTRILVLSCALGLGTAGLLQVVALLANHAGLNAIGTLIDWPNTLLQAAVPCQPDGTGCGTGKLSATAYFASLPLGAAAYAVIAHILLRRHLPADG